MKGVFRTAAVSEAPPFVRSTPHTLCTLIASPEKTVVFLNFPDVCPEPVLVKRPHLYINGSKLP
jgi:hypothetical protein